MVVYSLTNVSMVVRISTRTARVSRRWTPKHSATDGCRPRRSVSSTRNALEDLPEDLVFVQQLVRGRALLVPQQPELARLVHHGGVGGNLLGLRRRQVTGDLIDEHRDVIEQLLGGEYFVRRDRQQLSQTRKPRRRERQALSDDALTDHRGVVFRREKRHGTIPGR